MLSTLPLTYTRFSKVRQQTENICRRLQIEDYVPQPVVDVSPPKWHLGHTTWFFETFILKTHLPGYQPFDPNFNFVFNSYYETVGARVLRTDRGNLSRPGVERIYAYRKYVDEAMEKLLKEQPKPAWSDLLELGMQHEQQHQELLLSDIKFILGHNPLFPGLPDLHPVPDAKAVPLAFTEIPEGIYAIGFEGNGFSFDNEHGKHRVFLEPFAIANRTVTNAEFLEFMEDGGYQDFRHWLSEGWGWVNENQASSPLYWHKIEGEWMRYSHRGLEKLNPEAPVSHINFYEADAYARWAGHRLPTEFEWEVACRSLNPEGVSAANLADSTIWDPIVETKNNQFLGNTWEWTGSAYLPYPRFVTAPGAVGEYNGKFMVNQMVLRGGSCATPENHIRPTYRNFFHPHLQWQFTGIRLAKTL